MNETATEVAVQSINTLSSTQFGAIIAIQFLFLGAFMYFVIKQQNKQNDTVMEIMKETKEEYKEILNNITEVIFEVKNESKLANRSVEQSEKSLEYERNRGNDCYSKVYAKLEKIEDSVRTIKEVINKNS